MITFPGIRAISISDSNLRNLNLDKKFYDVAFLSRFFVIPKSIGSIKKSKEKLLSSECDFHSN